MKCAEVVLGLMSDNSRAYNVRIFDSTHPGITGATIATLAATDEQHAEAICRAINGAAWIQFHKA